MSSRRKGCPMRRLMRLALGSAALGLSVWGLAACKEAAKASLAASAPPLRTNEDLEADPTLRQGLWARLVVPAPQVTWNRLQQRIGGPLALLPSSLGYAVTSLFGLDARLQKDLDLGSPAMVFAVGETGEAPRPLAALRVADSTHLRTVLGQGHEASYRVEEAAGLVHLEPLRAAFPHAFALRVDGILLMGRDRRDIEHYGAKAAVWLKAQDGRLTNQALEADVDGEFFAKNVAPALKELWTTSWNERKASSKVNPGSGRPPGHREASESLDLELAEQLLQGPLREAMTTLEEIASANVRMSVDEATVAWTVALQPKTRDSQAPRDEKAFRWFSSEGQGDAALLETLPRSTRGGVLLRFPSNSSEASPAAPAALAPPAGPDWTGLFGPKMSSQERSRWKGVQAAWGRYRGDSLLVGVGGSQGPALSLRMASAEPAKLSRAFGQTLRGLQGGPLRSLLEGRVGIQSLQVLGPEAGDEQGGLGKMVWTNAWAGQGAGQTSRQSSSQTTPQSDRAMASVPLQWDWAAEEGAVTARVHWNVALGGEAVEAPEEARDTWGSHANLRSALRQVQGPVRLAAVVAPPAEDGAGVVPALLTVGVGEGQVLRARGAFSFGLLRQSAQRLAGL